MKQTVRSKRRQRLGLAFIVLSLAIGLVLTTFWLRSRGYSAEALYRVHVSVE
jgi:uncharacterized SAM-binding protein YcdF (DUF218 family)